MEAGNLSDELYRTYEWTDPISGKRVTYHIDNPELLYYERGHTCHRIVDAQGISHCVPAVGYFGCIVRWKNPVDTNPVNF